jgi:phosphohistidine phosphatase SixA
VFKKFKKLIFIFIIFISLIIYGWYALLNYTFPFQENSFFRSKFGYENLKDDYKWANKILKGGYILYFRHADREKWDRTVTGFDAYELFNNINAEDSWFARATCLSAQGKIEARLIGEVFKHANIKINKVASSPSCRAKQTAKLAFNRIDLIDSSILHPSAVNINEHDIMALRLKDLILNMEPKEGYNNVISGHGGTLDKYFYKIINNSDVSIRDLQTVYESGFFVIEVDKPNKKIYIKKMFRSFPGFARQIYILKDKSSYKDLK